MNGYQTTIGAHHHRSGRGTEKIHLSVGVEQVPALFQRAGFHTSNGDYPAKGKRLGKTDYKFEWNPKTYDGDDWTERKPGQPFFAQIQLWRGKNRNDDGRWYRGVAPKALGTLTKPEDKDYVDAPTLKGKVMTGYQGWFRKPNDLYDNGSWTHWVRNNTMTAENFTVDAWPDLTEYEPGALARAGSLTTASGAPAYLFSSASYSAVRKHFRWMRKHNIDGAWLQRFRPNAGTKPEWVLHNVSRAAAEEGRIWGVEYDVSSLDDATVLGIHNLVEYAIAMQDPTVPKASIGSFTGGTLSFTKRAGTSGLSHAIQESADRGGIDDWDKSPALPT